tara:strand:- start:7411 stop:8688 length:1278 start_codon:yes stop_codon:yes gene_type:complete
MPNTNYTPGNGNAPYGLPQTNPQGSNYAGVASTAVTESNLIEKAIARVIYDAAPAQFVALKVLNLGSFEDRNSDEFEYLEKTFGRVPLVPTATSAIVAASGSTSVSQSITVNQASFDGVSPNDIIIYPDGTHATVTAKAALVLTVRSVAGQGLPAVALTDVFAVQSTISADGTDQFYHYDRMTTVTRYNFIHFFHRAKRWARVEMQKYINAGTTDFMEKDSMEKVRQIRIDMFCAYWNGQRGEYTLAGGYTAKGMGGIVPTMRAAGSIEVTATVASLQAMFESTVLATNFKAEGATRFVYGTDSALLELSKIYKEERVRYEPNSKIADLGLDMIKVGSGNYVLTPCELFSEPSCFEAGWKDRLIILDQETVKPVKMKGIPQVEMGKTDNVANGSHKDYEDSWVRAQFSIEFYNPLASAIINIDRS